MTLANIAAYSLQLAVLALSAVIVTRIVRLRAPLPSLRFWQVILVITLILPLAQLANRDQAITTAPALVSFATALAIAPLTATGAGVASWLVNIAAAGIAIKILWLGVGLLRVRSIIRAAESAPLLDPLLTELSAALRTTATIAVTDEIQTPATVGFRRPVILLPRRVLSLSPRVQRAVVAHELLHVRRGDWLHTIVEEAWCAVLWFHPAARLIATRLSLARETVVDQAAIVLTRDRRAYAQALLAFSNPQPHLPGVAALIGRQHLSQRISLITEEDVMTRRRLALCLSIALLAAGAATSAAVTAFPISREVLQKTVYNPGDGVSLPVVVREVKPAYTAEAMQRLIQGSVWMDVVIDEAGDVTDVTVTTSLDKEYGLDDQAVKAARLWKFNPGRKDGKPVAVKVTLQMTFTLKK